MAPESEEALVRDLARARAGTGPLWGLASADLNVTLLARGPGEATPAHVNEERDVLWVVIDGDGTLELDGQRHQLRPLTSVLIEKGRRRRLLAGGHGIRYLSVHLARGGLQITRRGEGP